MVANGRMRISWLRREAFWYENQLSNWFLCYQTNTSLPSWNTLKVLNLLEKWIEKLHLSQFFVFL